MTYDAVKKTAAAALMAASLAAPALAETATSQIDLTYVWTAHPGMEERLVATYDAVGDVLEANEPGLLFYEVAVSETGNQIVIHEVFENSDALAFHLTETAAQFFPQLVEFATPGPFVIEAVI